MLEASTIINRHHISKFRRDITKETYSIKHLFEFTMTAGTFYVHMGRVACSKLAFVGLDACDPTHNQVHSQMEGPQRETANRQQEPRAQSGPNPDPKQHPARTQSAPNPHPTRTRRAHKHTQAQAPHTARTATSKPLCRHHKNPKAINKI